jgi:hypothetical protein
MGEGLSATEVGKEIAQHAKHGRSLYVDGEKVGEGTVGATAAMIFSADDTLDVAKEGGALVAEDYPVPNHFTGTVNWVEIDVGEAAEEADHQIDADERVRVAMARQ